LIIDVNDWDMPSNAIHKNLAKRVANCQSDG